MAEEKIELTPAQLARIERKRQNALLLRQSKVVAKGRHEAAKRAKVSRITDSEAGFLIEEEEVDGLKISEAQISNLVHPAAPLEDPDSLRCDMCGDSFNDSFLNRHFDMKVCDNCRDTEEEHRMISRSTAKIDYLLKDCDLDLREPPLRYVSRPNPHRSHWGEMRLYLESQVVARCYEVWGGEDGLEKEREKREERRFESRQRKYRKSMKELRMAVGTSRQSDKTAAHVHEFGEEKYDSERDVYLKQCQSCDFCEEYEKL